MKYINLLLSLYKLKKNTKKTRDEIIDLQQKKLRKIIKHAYNNSDYYHKTFIDEGITNENIDTLPISKFPTIDKSALIKNFNFIVTEKDLSQEELRKFDNDENKDKKTFKGKYHIVHSSGSTGKPAYFVYDNNGWEYMLIGVIRAALWNMSMFQILKYLFKGPRIMYIAATDGRYGGAMAVGDGIKGVKGNQLFIDINTPLKDWIEKTNNFKPDMIVGYPSAIKILGELVEKRKLNVDVFRVISCGEPLSVNLRNYFPSQTTRNFFQVIQVSYQFDEQKCSLENVIYSVKEQFQQKLTKDALQKNMNALSALEHNIPMKLVPLATKDYILRFANWFSYQKATSCISNVGKINMPAEITHYIRLFDLFVSTKTIQIATCSFEDNFVISIATAYYRNDLPKRFFRHLSDMDLEIEITTNMEQEE